MSPLHLGTVAERLDVYLHAHRFYSYKDLLAEAFLGNEDDFIDAFCDGSLPLAVRQQCQDTMSERTMEIFLLRRLVRQMQTQHQLLIDLLAEYRKAPWDTLAPEEEAPR